MKKTTIAIATIAALGLSTAAFAGMNKGFYAGANLGYSQNNFLNNANTDGLDVTDTGFAWNLHGGYMFNQYIGAELGYTQFNKVKLSSGSTDETVKFYALTAAAKGVYHFNPKWSVFAKAGLASNHGSSDYTDGSSTLSETDSNVSPLVGLGFGFDAMQNLTVNVGWTADFGGNPGADYFNDTTNTATTNDTGNINYFYGGVDYHF